MVRTIIAALMLAAPSAHADPLIIEPGNSWSDGGSIRSYLKERAKVDAIEIKGRCVSACTVFLGHPNVCVRRKADFGFHALSLWGTHAPPHIQQDYTRYLGSPELAEWFLAGPALKTRPTVWLTGSDMIDTFGYPECA